MDYEKKYKEALEWARKVIQGKVGFVLDEVLEKFPELKESDDERIRKWLIEMVEEIRKTNPTDASHNGNCSAATAWLEKQGGTKDKLNTMLDDSLSRETKESWNKFLDEQKPVWSREDEQNLNAALGYIDDEYLRRWLKDVIYNKYEKSTLSEEDERIRKDLISHFKETIENIKSEEIVPHSAKILVGKMQKWIAWLEKQREQKPTDKVKPKFKVGDWILTDKNHIWYVDEDCSTTGYLYRLVAINGKVEVAEYEVVDEHARLWTIADAKDGDILFQDLMCGKTFIYNGINPDMAILYSFLISNDGEDVLPYHIGKPNTGIGFIEENKNIIHPATKEQRELLFAKMKEAGYEWDAEKKEVKKTHVIDEGKAEMDYCFTKMMNGEKVSHILSEEDDIFFKAIVRDIENIKYISENAKSDRINWLKSLKERITWKPSDEQMEALKQAKTDACGKPYFNALASLYVNLKVI